MNRTTRRYDVPAVVFQHWAHRMEFTCATCHPALFQMKAGAHEILMERMAARSTFCLACHNGDIAWKPINCSRCHRTGDRPELGRMFPGAGGGVRRGNRDPEAALAGLPRDSAGRVDWMEAVRRGLLAPRASAAMRALDAQTVPRDSVMPRTGDRPPVVFPHASHTRWLECRNCHPDIFVPKNGGNAITMARMWARRDCGVCHGVVAFPLDDCSRCHRGRPNP
jgi:c(7)-type cytochrome triheme protein